MAVGSTATWKRQYAAGPLPAMTADACAVVTVLFAQISIVSPVG